MTAQDLGLPPAPDAGTTALFLDIDGTLVEFARSPEEVVVEPGLFALLDDLRDRLGGALALVSGRTIESIDQLLAPLVLDAAGVHGGQWRLGGQRDALPPPPAAFAGITAELRRFAEAHPGVRLEDKVEGLALHTRLRPDAEAEAIALVEDGHRRLGQAYRLQKGNAVIELVPALATKGNGVKRMMSVPPYRHRTPVFVGDDLTDESGFLAARALGGFGVLVGPPRETAARYRLPSVPGVHRWLEAVLHRA